MRLSFLLIIGIAFTSLHAFAQGTIGMKYVGGSIGFNTQKASSSQLANSQKESGFYFNPSLGWFIKNNLVGGIEFYINNSHSESGNPATSTKRNSLGFGVFGRNYQNLGKGFFLFAHHNLTYSTDRYDYTVSGTSQSKSSGYSLQTNLYPGLSYAIKKKLLVETSMGNLFYAGYSHSNNPGNSQNSDLSINRFSMGVNANAFSSINLGLRFLLD